MTALTRFLMIATSSLLIACDQPIIISPDAELPDGARYQGDIVSGKFHGNGTLVYPDGAYYEGEFIDGIFNGKGVYVNQFGERYEGQFEGGVSQGIGTLNESGGNVYTGSFVKGLYHGHGKYTLTSGAVYEGDFKNGQYDGAGKYVHDQYEYSGTLVKGELNGEGRYKSEDGSVYEGKVKSWYAHGKGVKTLEDGTVITANFVDGYVEGEGNIMLANGNSYRGSISLDYPNGEGTMVYADNRVYEGEFVYGRRHGTGTLTTPANENQAKTVVAGKWRRDKLIHDLSADEPQHSQSEVALQNHQRLLDLALDKLTKSNALHNLYFLGIAGDGSQSVFRREIEFIQPLIEERYASNGKSIALINHHDSAAKYPMATRLSIATAIKTIGQSMDPDNDVLFIYMTSHGSKEHEFYLNHDSINLPPLSASSLGDMLKSANIKWKVVIISACYSGGFIPALKDDTTLILTAADADNTSFGCSEESEMTYFGRALFKETLKEQTTLSLPDAFKLAKDLVVQWEEEEELSSSNPMIHAPTAILEKLEALRATTSRSVNSASDQQD